MNLTLAAHAVWDEAILGFVRSRQPAAVAELSARVSTEIAAMAQLAAASGWTANPVSYHRDPPALQDREVRTLGMVSLPRRHEYVAFESGFAPRDIEPGAHRWVTPGRNATVYVRLLRHPTPRPWVVCLHGFGGSGSRFEHSTLWASHFHNALDVNVAVPVLPFHGPRRTSDEAELLSLDLIATLHGITQALWDVRRLIGWLRRLDGTPIGVYGQSLGGFLTTLLAGLEPVDGVVAGVPFVDVLDLMAHHGPPAQYSSVLRADSAYAAFRTVSPLALTPVLPADRRTVLAGRVDQLIPTAQSIRLEQAWRPSRVHWFDGGHAGYGWSRQNLKVVTDFLGCTLSAAGGRPT